MMCRHTTVLHGGGCHFFFVFLAFILFTLRPNSRRGHDGQTERLGLQIYRKFARQYVNCDATSLLLHVPVT